MVAPRLASLDAFRGATIAGMILVNNPGNWNSVYPPLLHAEWHGWTPTDLIFPFFLFIVGVAMPLSYTSRRAGGSWSAELGGHALRRSLIIFGLGTFMALFPFFNTWDTLRIMGVLQRIGLVYLVASSIYLTVGPRGRWVGTAVLLIGYWALMTLVPVPGFGPGDLSPEANLGAFIDRAVLGQEHLWQGNLWDPEGLLSSFPAVATTLLGIFTGELLLSEGPAWRRLLILAGTSLGAIALGLYWGQFFPINKSLWTSSYVLFTAGMGGLLLAGLYWAIDVRGWRAWARPLVVYGMNPIAVFVASGLLSKSLILWSVPSEGGATTSAYDWIYTSFFRPLAEPTDASLAFALTHVTIWLVVAWLLHSRRLYIKI
jgi:predicted acyltransferase